MKFLITSEESKRNMTTNNLGDKIHLIAQFFVHQTSNERNKEIVSCLRKNIENSSIDRIHLLNERIYRNDELSVPENEKVTQTKIGKRMSYKDVFQYVRENNIQGYIIIANIDIFFDKSINNIHFSHIDTKKEMFALLRYEYDEISTYSSPIFGPRSDSQDTWIFHSNTIISKLQENGFNFQLGVPGCDNKIIYLMKVLGYNVINDPIFIRTYHYHNSKIRNYNNKDVLQKPYGFISPSGFSERSVSHGIPTFTSNETVRFEDNDVIREYIHSKLKNNEKFIIPRIAGVENNFAVYCSIHGSETHENKLHIQRYIENSSKTMKNNAGIQLSNIISIAKYSKLYMDAFENCDLFSGWDINGNVYPYISVSHNYITTRYSSKQIVWAPALDVFHYIYSNPWTHSLKGKRILIVSPFEETILEQIPHREKLFDGVDLFPGCTFVTIKPPMTQGSEISREFDEELSDFYVNLDKLKDSYDVALLSCGGYGNIISNHIFSVHNKSAIYMGGTLQTAFGILGRRWLLERPDIIRIFMNKYWSRSKETEKPKGHENIEGGCYW